MSAGASLKVDASRFNAAMRELSRASGRSMVKVVESEGAAVLQKALDLTKSARVREVRDRAKRRKVWFLPEGAYTPVTPGGRKYRAERVNVDTSRGRRRVMYRMDRYYPDALWERIGADMAREVKQMLGRRGLAKQSWKLLAQSLGWRVIAPSYVAAARPQMPALVSGHRIRSGDRYGVRLVNRQVTARSVGADGHGALRRAIAGRVKYFERSARAGATASAEAVARAYPGLKVR